MTVERTVMPDSTLPHPPQLRSSADRGVEECRRQVKDVLGNTFNDEIITNAIRKVQNRMGLTVDVRSRASDVIQELLDAGPPADASPTPASSPTRLLPPSSTTPAPPLLALPAPAPISGEEEQMQKAIAMSLEAGTGGVPKLTSEEAELQRALEESMAEAKGSSALFQDPLNPHLRTRPSPDWPVGLKNVGNTCWFNVVIQALFHLPNFRRLIFSVPTDEEKAGEGQVKEEEMPSPKQEFIRELQRIFALLLFSKRKYLDPSAVVELLRAQSPSLRSSQPSNLPNTQEDVNEVTHALMALIEGAFKEFPSSSPSGGESPSHAQLPSITSTEMDAVSFEPKTVIEELFFTAAEKRIIRQTPGSSEGRRSLETHLLLPLEVGGCERVEDGLEAGLFSEIADEEGTRSETWLIRPPPILLLDLKRFAYSREKRVAEKLHTRLAFPTTLYLDRFMQRNEADVCVRRAEVGRLRRSQGELEERLGAFQSFHASGVSLSRALELVQRLVGGQKGGTGEPAVPSPPGQNSPMDTDSGKASPRAGTSESMETDEAGLSSDVAAIADSIPQISRHIFTQTLSDLAAQVTLATNRLQEEVDEVKSKIESAYDAPHLRKDGYRLHAVLVHEGQVSSGHYWAFIRDPDDEDESSPSSGWKKFNDVQRLEGESVVVKVSGCGWREVVGDGFGGEGSHASAYCLVYIAHAHLHRIFPSQSQSLGIPGNKGMALKWETSDP